MPLVLYCLSCEQRSTRAQLRPECAEAVFRQELEADEDLRLNIVVYKKCLADKKTFCPHVPPGNARARDCLVAARNEEGFSSACRCGLGAAALGLQEMFEVAGGVGSGCLQAQRGAGQRAGGPHAVDGLGACV